MLNSRKQEEFARFVAGGLSNRMAALRAGYSQKSAGAIGCQLARDPRVAERIRQLRENPPASTSTTGPAHAITVTDTTGRMVGLFIPAAALSDVGFTITGTR